MKKCPLCDSEAWRVYYHWFPMWLCSDDECGCAFGFWAWIHRLHFDGEFIVKDSVRGR